MISSRGIAVQGVGFSPAVLAVQGFSQVGATQVVPTSTPAWASGPDTVGPQRRRRSNAQEEDLLVALLL